MDDIDSSAGEENLTRQSLARKKGDRCCPLKIFYSNNLIDKLK